MPIQSHLGAYHHPSPGREQNTGNDSRISLPLLPGRVSAPGGALVALVPGLGALVPVTAGAGKQGPSFSLPAGLGDWGAAATA